MADADEAELEAARQRRIADACLGAGGDAGGRVGVYRRLVRGNLETIARRILPRTAAQLDRLRSDAFHDWFGRFLAERGPRTAFLRDVPPEFIRWAGPLWATDGDVPPFLPDLARHEVDLFEIDAAPRDRTPAPLAEVALDRPLVFAAARRLARYDHAVQEPGDPVERRVTHLLIHRDHENTVHVKVIDERDLPLLELLLGGTPLGEAIAASVTRRAADASEPPVTALAEWLAGLGETGALLGGER